MHGSIGGLFSRLAAVAALALATVFLAACGSDGGDDTTTEGGSTDGFGPQVVSQEDLDAQEEGSAGRGLLDWWQAFQFQDANTVISLTSENTLDELGEKDLEELVKTRGQGLQGVEVLGATESGDTASVRAGLLTFQPEEEGGPIPDEPTASRPITFTMEKDGDQWLFDTPTYLQPMIEGLQAAEEAADQGGDSGDQSSDSGGSN